MHFAQASYAVGAQSFLYTEKVQAFSKRDHYSVNAITYLLMHC